MNLIINHRDNPLVIGLFCLIARQFIIHQLPMPLSDVDLTVYDPSLSRGAVKRAMHRLVDDGWPVQIRQGNKNTYQPAWGRIRGTPRVWQLNHSLLGRPRHLETTSFDKRILDLHFGRLYLHDRLPLVVDRYVSAPTLGLRDVGAYLLTKAGYSQGTAALVKCGLVQDGMACPMPAEGTVLAQISQQTITDEAAPTLTEKGLRRLGFEILPPEKPAKSGGQLLVYVPPKSPGMIGQLIGRLIGLEDEKTGSKTGVLPAPGADKSSSTFETEKITWIHMDLMP